MIDDGFIEFCPEIQTFHVPRLDGVNHCRYGLWRVFERPCEWLFKRDRRMQFTKVGNDK